MYCMRLSNIRKLYDASGIHNDSCLITKVRLQIANVSVDWLIRKGFSHAKQYYTKAYC